ncbi:FUSC family protein [Rhodoferax lacus]|uniref:FUSC family protein n=1 Tax=Rhodoferax lacus TaxID=2184758 RepID=A0A3E1R7K7_9BURK|nr:FUSC family protein [Rhodoferax lacus]RFO95349.1 FUSC family protein [Rhodoferax lacus]
MQAPHSLHQRSKDLLRILLSYYVTNGMSAALGLFLISGVVHILLGATAAGAASIGVIVCIPPDQAAPKKGKFWHLLPAALLGVPLFLAVQLLHARPLALGLLLVPATFLAFLAGAWGKRGLPIVVSVMFAMVFSMAVPPQAGVAGAVDSSLYFGLGAGLYVLYSTCANIVLNGRYRSQMLADTLMALARLMRTQAEQFVLNASADKRDKAPLIGVLLRQQAVLTEQLQAARDLLLESPNSARRQQLAAMLMVVLEMRDHLMACELDLDTLHASAGNYQAMQGMSDILVSLSVDVERVADALLLGHLPAALRNCRPQLAALSWDPRVGGHEPANAMLARGLANRVGNLSDEAVRIAALARGEAQPDIDLIRTNWQMFVSTTDWSWRPFVSVWRWDAPPLRHAVRATLAIGFAYALGLAMPWGSHDYWIVLTIVVVLRGSLAQTLERRNSRVAGTVIGCVLAGLILASHAPPLVLLLVLTLAQAVAHALALRVYLVTAVAATVLGLVQAHMVNAGASPVFAELERVADTLLGVSIAWAFSYVLPSWERHQIAALVARALAAQARYAQLSLTLGQVQRMENAPELAWRLARRECYDSLSALVNATQRALVEPRAEQPPLEASGRILARSYQLLAQLTSVKTMLMLRRERLQLERIAQPLLQTAQTLEEALQPGVALTTQAPADYALANELEQLSDPFESDLTPWMLRRLGLLTGIARQLQQDANAFGSKVAAP